MPLRNQDRKSGFRPKMEAVWIFIFKLRGVNGVQGDQRSVPQQLIAVLQDSWVSLNYFISDSVA